VISYKDIAFQIFLTVTKSLITVTYKWRDWTKQTTLVMHDVIAGLHCWQYWTKFLLYPRNGQINKQINIARITGLTQAWKTLQ